MKKLLFFALIIFLAVSCKKQKFAPEGPTDVRIENLSDMNWVQVIVNTSGGIDTFDNIAKHDTSDYSRFEKAYVFAEITATVNGEKFSTGPVNYMGLTYQGRVKLTYQVYIESIVNKKLKISNCQLDSELTDF